MLSKIVQFWTKVDLSCLFTGFILTNNILLFFRKIIVTCCISKGFSDIT